MTHPEPAEAVDRLFTDAVAYELWGEAGAEWLYPEEAEHVAGAVANRRAQFAAGRHCARLALEVLGFDVGPIPVGERRAPVWPAGASGSISHTEGYAVAVAARWSDRSPVTIGVDAERVGRVHEDLYQRLFVVAERERLRSLPADEQAAVATSMFGAKEAFYKAQFPVTGAWVGFHDVELQPQQDGFTLHPASDLAPLAAFRWPLRARSVIRHDIAVTAVEAQAKLTG